MADTNKNLPLIILGIGVGAVVLYMFLKSRRAGMMTEGMTEEEMMALEAGVLPPVDPCLKPDGTRLPDWACGAVALLNPIAKASVDVYRTKTDYDLQRSQMRAY